MWLSTASSRPISPSSASIIKAAAVIGLVIDKMRKIASSRIGLPRSMSICPHMPVCTSWPLR
jgi:hypothetical protein